MYCIKCGKQLEEKSIFCSACGEKVRASGSTSVAKRTILIGYLSNRQNRKKMILLAGILAVIGLVSLFLLRTPAYEKPVHQFMKACTTGKYSDFEKVFPVKYMNSEIQAEMKEYFEDGFLDELKESSTKFNRRSAKVVDKTKMSQSELEDLELFYQFWLELDELEIVNGYTLDVELTVTVDGEKETQEIEMGVVEIDGKWYLDMSFFN